MGNKTICVDCFYYVFDFCGYTAKENGKDFYSKIWIIEKCEDINKEGKCQYFKKSKNKIDLYILPLKYKHCDYCKNGTVNYHEWICHYPDSYDYVHDEQRYKRVNRRDYNKDGNCEKYVKGKNNYKDAKSDW